MVDQWYFSKAELLESPSILEGMSFKEMEYDRSKGCLYLLAVAAKLNLPQLVVATACTFFHRFYMRHSMKRFHVYDIAATSLLVATKVEECTRRLKDFINVCNQKAQKNDQLHIEENTREYKKWKDTVLANETVLLEAICFDFTIDHPQGIVLEIGEMLQVPDECIRRAWMLLYQALGMPLCLLYHPRMVASAALLLAWHFTYDTQPPEEWWEKIGVDASSVHELAAEMLDYYHAHYLKRPSSQLPTSKSSYYANSPTHISSSKSPSPYSNPSSQSHHR
ncbi:cyclin-like protein [Dichotomocladium elegans]|nr:cyclin-like protein [Dichotomocladium elegans]